MKDGAYSMVDCMYTISDCTYAFLQFQPWLGEGSFPKQRNWCLGAECSRCYGGEGWAGHYPCSSVDEEWWVWQQAWLYCEQCPVAVLQW